MTQTSSRTQCSISMHNDSKLGQETLGWHEKCFFSYEILQMYAIMREPGSLAALVSVTRYTILSEIVNQRTLHLVRCHLDFGGSSAEQRSAG
jgi:hypothetical protein